MSDYVVKIMPRAEQDIERNAQWWANNHDVNQAVKWFYAVRRQILSLADSPTSHGLSAENDDFPYEIRDKLIGLGSRPGFRAVFTVREHTVFVLAVLRGSQRPLRPGDVEL